MAFPDGADPDRRARRRRDRRMPSPVDDIDWGAESDYPRHSMPYRNRRAKRDLLDDAESRLPSRRHARDPSTHPKPNAVMSISRRPSAAPKRTRGNLTYEHTTSGTDSRRSSRKAVSPRYHISTPGSRRSSHTTVSGSDEGSTWTPSSDEDERGRVSVEKYRASPARHHPRHSPRHSRGRYQTKIKVPLAPEVGEDEEEDESSEDDDDDDDEDEDDYESEDGYSEEHDDVETEPRLRARLRGRHSRGDDILSRSPSGPRQPTYRNRDRLRDAPLSEAHYRPQSYQRPSRRTYGSDIVHVKPKVIRRSNITGGHAPSSLTISTRRSSFIDPGYPRSTRTTYERPTKIAKCVVCFDELPSRKTAKLDCGHRMCNSCLKRSFKLSMTDEQHMPPQCCDENIPLTHVDHLFDMNFKKTWDRKFIEHSTRHRLYCPSKRCGALIQPENITRERGRKQGRCSQCKTRVCGACNLKWHSSRECPADEATNDILEQARDEGWQRCYRCRAMVELKEGCNHMTCRCGAQFCMACGDKWKSCDCPWFSYETTEPDDFDRVPTLSRSETFPRAHQPRRYRGSEPPTTLPLAPRGRAFDDDMLVRHPHDRRDRDLARRFEREPPPRDPHFRERERPRGLEREPVDETIRESLEDDDYDYDDDDYDGYDLDEDGEYRGSVGDDLGHGSRRRRRGAHDDYQEGDETVVPSSPPSAALHGYGRTARTADYIDDVSKARGVRGSSMERRLADRFSPQRSTHVPPPPQSPIHGGHPRHPQHGLPPMSPLISMPPPPHRPIAPPAPTPPPRRHTGEEDTYVIRMTRPTERSIAGPGGRARHEYADEMPMHAPPSRHYSDEISTAKSTMAGLDGPGRGMNRVYEWRNYVAPGAPEEDVVLTQRRRIPF